MKSIFKLLLISVLLNSCTEPNKTFLASEISILPKPVSIELFEESFSIENNSSISITDKAQKIAANHLISLIQSTTKYNIKLKENKKSSITFIKDNNLKLESYQLSVTTNNINIAASSAAGYFYGVQSLAQLITKHKIEKSKKTKWLVPSLIINDEPRFKWRAYMLDESRYFHGEAFVKRILDEMATLKMNVFHWHLIDDAGWRIEIKKYPLLTKVGAFRTDSEIGTWKSGKTSGKPHGGFYTQEQIKNIVAYAAERNITIVPEFEMPGHSSAAIASYTWLGTAGIDIDVPIKFGRLYDNYDVTKPEVVQFIKDVLTEMFELFPSKVIHIGGDEVGYKVWEESKSVQKYMRENGLKTPADLQIDFTNKISQFMEKNGRRMMGWNEILGKNIHKGFAEKKNDKEAETTLAKNAVIHFWKGDLAMAQDAAKKGYGIVNSIHTHTYLDYDYKYTPLEKSYNFDPIPKGLEKKYHKNIYGSGCQMWSEWTPTNKDIEYQTFPRIAAYAEVGWTQLELKNFESFKIALKKMQKRWDTLHINYAKILE